MDVMKMLKVLDGVDLKSGSADELKKVTQSFSSDVQRILHCGVDILAVNELAGRSVQVIFKLSDQRNEYKIYNVDIKGLKISWHASQIEDLQFVTLSIYFNSNTISHLEIKKLIKEQEIKLFIFADRQGNCAEDVAEFHLEIK